MDVKFYSSYHALNPAFIAVYPLFLSEAETKLHWEVGILQYISILVLLSVRQQGGVDRKETIAQDK